MLPWVGRWLTNFHICGFSVFIQRVRNDNQALFLF
uniref:Uncharacterized protein n=1 Tax=Rhizophora mucronata TaxID=61149 RepID=A0A2P2K9B2_RHIMU